MLFIYTAYYQEGKQGPNRDGSGLSQPGAVVGPAGNDATVVRLTDGNPSEWLPKAPDSG
jgi:hypothetical protein